MGKTRYIVTMEVEVDNKSNYIGALGIDDALETLCDTFKDMVYDMDDIKAISVEVELDD